MVPSGRIAVLWLSLFAVFVPSGGSSSTLRAQTITTASIEGRVALSDGASADGARIRVVNRESGYALESVVRSGRFALLGLEVGGPYSLAVQRIGYRTERREIVHLSLGEKLEVNFTLDRLATLLDTVRIVDGPSTIAPLPMGVGKLISDSALRRLPTIDRDMYDFVRLVPQIVAGGARTGISGGGVSTRFNSFLLDGVSERGLLGNLAAGTGQGGKSISIEAVKEYQVLLSPYSVRYADFAGALVNAVAKSGSNELSGSVFVFARNDALARKTPFLAGAPYERAQFGGAVGGPIVRGRARFFVASELQRLVSPAPGPYEGQPASSDAPLPTASADIEKFFSLLVERGLDPGSAGRMNIGNPLRNLFARIDISVPERRSRLVLWNNYGLVDNIVFSRKSATSFFTRGATTFPLSSYRYTSSVTKEIAAAQIVTSLRQGGVNEFLAAYKLQPSASTPDVAATLVSVAVPRADVPGNVFLESGSNEAAHGISVRQTSWEIADDVTLVVGPRHRVSFGARAERFGITGTGLPGAYGSWLFSSLDSLRAGKVERYRLVTEPPGARLPKPAMQFGFYAGDEWNAHERFSLVGGLRADAITAQEAAAYNPVVDSIFGRRTSDVRRLRVLWSPRIGFAWTVTRDSHLRGGAGLFVARPPVGWLGQSLRNNGATVGTLQCGVGGSGPAPAFVSDYRNQPRACANGAGALGPGTGGPVDFTDSNLRLAETMRASLSYDRTLLRNTTWKLEGLLTRNRADFAFVNMNLAGPVSVDRHGRVLYGVIDATGRATPALVAGRFSEVIDLRNQSRNRAVQISTEIEHRPSAALVLSGFYSYSRVRDVQTPPGNFAALENWTGGRVVSGLHSDLNTSVSGLDIPHRFGFTGMISFGGNAWTTDISLYYVGESGAPFTYIAAAGRGRGDLNADGTNLNDPIYVPRSTSDTTEILFFGSPAEIAAQQSALEVLITSSKCLARQRGRIMARNSCRAPWVNLANMSIRQKLPWLGSDGMMLQLDVFNLLNLLSAKWGQFQVVTPGPNASLLEQVGQTAGSPLQAQPVFRLNQSGARFDTQNVQSAYQLQLGVRYSF